MLLSTPARRGSLMQQTDVERARDEDADLAAALAAMRRAATCESIPSCAQQSFYATVSLLEKLAPQRSLHAVPPLSSPPRPKAPRRLSHRPPLLQPVARHS